MMEINKKETLESIIRSGFAAIPYVGQVLTEICFDYRGRIKQNRLNRFTELLFDYFLENPDVDIEDIKTEDFSDLFEWVLKRVVLTKSEKKLERFRDILINKIEKPSYEIDNLELYLDLISNLSETEIKVLYYHRFFNKEYKKDKELLSELEFNLITKKENVDKERDAQRSGYANNLSLALSEYNILEQKINRLKPLINSYDKYRKAEFYEISVDDFLYCKQSLYSKALLVDSGVGAIGVRPFEIMSITVFGQEFVNFIMRE